MGRFTLKNPQKSLQKLAKALILAFFRCRKSVEFHKSGASKAAFSAAPAYGNSGRFHCTMLSIQAHLWTSAHLFFELATKTAHPNPIAHIQVTLTVGVWIHAYNHMGSCDEIGHERLKRLRDRNNI